MILIYSNTTSSRLQYICSFIFKELMGNEFVITNDTNDFEQYDGVKINYSNTPISNSKFQISNYSLLLENDIKKQPVECFETRDYKAFFKTTNSDFPFDIFAASFYLLSRYEEYLPHEKDMYGRYAHENSLAFKEKFLQLPLINIWVKYLAKALQLSNPTFQISNPTFKFIPTYDIDIAYSYKHKPLTRNIGGAVKTLMAHGFTRFMERNAVLLGTKKDPFDTYDWLDGLHEEYNLKPIYFFLVAEKNSLYDKNILPHTTAMKQLIQRHAAKYSVAIHPSWQSGDAIDVLKNELNYLKNISNKQITQSRQHYIRFNLPDGYRRLIDIEIKDDHSMGYGSINGFRASVASSFYWYDLQKEEQTSLRINPFCYMDANSLYEEHLSTDAAYDEMMHYYNICKKVNGTLITLWHNHILGTDRLYDGWANAYKKFIASI